MRKFTNIPSVIFSCALIFSNFSCQVKQAPNEKMYASSIGVTRPTAQIADADIRFLVDAYSNGLFKIQLADEALVRSTSTEAKQLATSIKKFHTNANANIEAVAGQHNFALPLDLTDEQKATWKKLVKERGWNFDTRFSEVVDEHAQKEAGIYSSVKTNDEIVSAFASEAMLEIEKQLSLSDILSKTIAARTFDNTDLPIAKQRKTSGTINAIAKH